MGVFYLLYAYLQVKKKNTMLYQDYQSKSLISDMKSMEPDCGQILLHVTSSHVRDPITAILMRCPPCCTLKQSGQLS